jgi:thiol-disulfide isomerase/thioredoxin
VGTATAEPTPQAVLDQAWATAELVDVATGDRFTIAELVAAGRPVVLETMAIWCSNCLAQQRRIEEALERTEPGSVAYVVLTVDPAEDAAKLARYRDQNGFDGIYAVADRGTSRALAAEFGDQVLNPPATPVVLISPSGRVTLTAYGPKSVDEIASLVEEHRS